MLLKMQVFGTFRIVGLILSDVSKCRSAFIFKWAGIAFHYGLDVPGIESRWR
jgi:hypothetical protein